jgi:hypothetical protein
MLEDDDIVFISNGTDFILPASTNNDADTDGNRFPRFAMLCDYFLLISLDNSKFFSSNTV